MSRINLTLLGSSGVGKSTLLHRFKTGEFKEPDKCTISAAEFHAKKVQVDGKEVSIFLWDTSGQERYHAIVRSYYRKGDGVLLVYDVTDAPSFCTLSKWLCELKEVNENAQVLIVGNKNDDPAKKNVNVSMVKNFARTENLEYMEISALTGENVDEAFSYLIRKILLAKGIISENTGSEKGSSKSKKIPDEKDGKEIVLLTKVPSSAAPSCSPKKKSGCC